MSKIEVNEIVNQSGDNDSGIDLTTNDQIGFKIANASKWTLNSSGNLFPSSTSQGIVLGATSDTSANRLDDYEEGTWTPEIIGDGGNSGQAYQLQQGSYTKTGRQISCMFFIRFQTEGSFSGSYLRLSGFPFTIKSQPQTVHLTAIYFTNLGDSYISLGAQAYEGTTSAFIWGKKSATTSREYLGTSDLTNATDLSGSFIYNI